MSHPPAKCRNCSEIFPALGYRIENSHNISFFGNSYSPCPYCGGTADVLDGVYDFVGNAVKLVSGPATTWEALRSAAKIISDSQAAGESAEKTLERASEILPSLRNLKGKVQSLLLAAVFYAITKLADHYVDPLLDPPELTPAVIQTIVQDAVAEGLRRHDAAAKAAKISKVPTDQTLNTPSVKTSSDMEPIPPQFPKSMEKLLRQMAERYGIKPAQRIFDRNPKGDNYPDMEESKRK